MLEMEPNIVAGGHIENEKNKPFGTRMYASMQFPSSVAAAQSRQQTLFIILKFSNELIAQRI